MKARDINVWQTYSRQKVSKGQLACAWSLQRAPTCTCQNPSRAEGLQNPHSRHSNHPTSLRSNRTARSAVVRALILAVSTPGDQTRAQCATAQKRKGSSETT